MTDARDDLERRAEAVRRFNRFYTQKIGVLGDRRRWRSFSLTQVRVLYELAHRDRPTAAALAKDIGLDQGYLSRILRGFERRGFLRRARADDDARKSHLSLTRKGVDALVPLDEQAHAEIAALLAASTDADQRRLLDAMHTIEQILGGAPARPKEPFSVRAPLPGDLGWVVQRHGALYAGELGWGAAFEAYVAQIAADFAQRGDAEHERFFVAESGGERAGSAIVVRHARSSAQLRLLLVETEFRGRGLGRLLVDECVRFARAAGYRKILLWTDSELHAARAVYERAGFRRVREEQRSDFGPPRVAELWELEL